VSQDSSHARQKQRQQQHGQYIGNALLGSPDPISVVSDQSGFQLHHMELVTVKGGFRRLGISTTHAQVSHIENLTSGMRCHFLCCCSSGRDVGRGSASVVDCGCASLSWDIASTGSLRVCAVASDAQLSDVMYQKLAAVPLPFNRKTEWQSPWPIPLLHTSLRAATAARTCQQPRWLDCS
jgi:hypothetical protein